MLLGICDEYYAMKDCLIAAGIVKLDMLSAHLHRRRFDRACSSHPFHCDKTLVDVIGTTPLIAAFVGTLGARHLRPTSRCFLRTTTQAKMLSPQLCICGGYSGSAYLKGAAYWDSTALSWSTLPPAFVPRRDAAVAVLSPHVFLCGGHNRARTLDSVDRLDLRSMRWEQIAPMSEARSGAVAGVLQGRLVVCGGQSSQHFQNCLKTVEIFNDDTATWEGVRQMQEERHGAVAGVIQNRLYVIGGCNAYRLLRSMESIGSTLSHWQTEPSMSRRRHGAAGVPLTGSMYVCGGQTSTETASSSVECFDASMATWVTISARCSYDAGAVQRYARQAAVSTYLGVRMKSQRWPA